MQKICFKCGVAVARPDCHKNRYGEYVCRSCQAAGVKASWWQALRQVSKKMVRRIVLWLTGAALLVLFVYLFFGFLARMDN